MDAKVAICLPEIAGNSAAKITTFFTATAADLLIGTAGSSNNRAPDITRTGLRLTGTLSLGLSGWLKQHRDGGTRPITFRVEADHSGIRDDTIAGAVSATLRACREPDLAGREIWIESHAARLSSHDLWSLIDSVGDRRVGLWLDMHSLAAMGEPAGVAFKRLAQFLRVVSWPLDEIRRSLQSNDTAALSRAIEILKGLAFRGVIGVELSSDALDDAESNATDAAAAIAFLRAELARPVVQLSAYKGDKHAPKFAPR